MGFDIERLVAFDPQESPDLICCICSCVLEDPTSTKCGHTFCLQCLIKWKGASIPFNCPVCRSSVETIRLKPTNAELFNKWQALRIRCNYDRSGCQVVMKVGDLQAHLSTCPYRGQSPPPPVVIQPSAPSPSIESPNRTRVSIVDTSSSPLVNDQSCCQSALNFLRRAFTTIGQFCTQTGHAILAFGRLLHSHRLALMYTLFSIMCIILVQLGITLEHHCSAYPSLPTAVLTLGISAFCLTLVHMIKKTVNRFRENKCRIMYLLLIVCIIITSYVGILLYVGSWNEWNWIPPGSCNTLLLFISFWLVNLLVIFTISWAVYRLFLKRLCIYLFE